MVARLPDTESDTPAPNADPADAKVVALPVVDPDDGDPEGDTIKLVKNGMVRVVVDGQVYRLRRPKMGGLRKLRELQGEVNDELSEAQADLQAAQVSAIQVAKEGDEAGGDVTARLDQVKAATRKVRDAVKVLNGVRDGRWPEWWALAFEITSIEKAAPPDDMPGWAGDANIVRAVMEHWQTDPLGRGA